MKKRYINTVIFVSFVILILLILMLLFNESTLIITMGSILIPVAITFLVEYDNRKKELLKNFYLPLFLYIRTYLDILSADDNQLKMGKKHDLIDKISNDLYSFLYDHANNISDELEPIFNTQHFYRYFNTNEFQRNYNLVILAPILLTEYIELYSILHIEQFFKLNLNPNNLKIELRLLCVTYVQIFILKISMENDYISSIYETVELHKQTLNNEDIVLRYVDISKYLFKNNTNQSNYTELEHFLKNKYNINFKLPTK